MFIKLLINNNLKELQQGHTEWNCVNNITYVLVFGQNGICGSNDCECSLGDVDSDEVGQLVPSFALHADHDLEQLQELHGHYRELLRETRFMAQRAIKFDFTFISDFVSLA